MSGGEGVVELCRNTANSLRALNKPSLIAVALESAADALEAQAARIAQLETALAGAREGLQQAEAWFTEYAEGHKAKSNAAPLMSDESRSYRDKADRNRMRAEYFAHLLKEPPHADR